MRDLLELTKPRITILILICTGVGYLFGPRNLFEFSILAHVLLGTAFMASGTSALNQWYEAESDAKMRRTRERPIAAGRTKRSHGFRLVWCYPRAASWSWGSERTHWRRHLGCSRC